MERQPGHSARGQHDSIKEQYDQVIGDGSYEEGMARMALYHRHCQRTTSQIPKARSWG